MASALSLKLTLKQSVILNIRFKDVKQPKPKVYPHINISYAKSCTIILFFSHATSALDPSEVIRHLLSHQLIAEMCSISYYWFLSLQNPAPGPAQTVLMHLVLCEAGNSLPTPSNIKQSPNSKISLKTHHLDTAS